MSAAHDYTEIDGAIIEAIKAGAPVLFSSMIHFKSRVRILAGELSLAEFEHAEAWRIVDRRLQALRRAGKIKHQRKGGEGWVLA